MSKPHFNEIIHFVEYFCRLPSTICCLAFASTVMTQLWYRIYAGPAFEGLISHQSLPFSRALAAPRLCQHFIWCTRAADTGHRSQCAGTYHLLATNNYNIKEMQQTQLENSHIPLLLFDAMKWYLTRTFICNWRHPLKYTHDVLSQCFVSIYWLTHCGLLMPCGVASDILVNIGSNDNARSHYLSQRWHNVSWTFPSNTQVSFTKML